MIGALGRFHEISITTADITASIAFYRELGFTECETLPVWPHPYAVFSDGDLTIGLHQYKFPSPSITCVDEHLHAAREKLRTAGVSAAFDISDPHRFNEFGYRDPGGTMITVLERPTHRARTTKRSVCGQFLFLDLPSPSVETSEQFWGRGTTAGGLPIRWHDAAIDQGVWLSFAGDAREGTLTAPEGTRLVMASANRSSAGSD